DPSLVKELTFTAKDRDSAVFEHLVRIMTQYGKNFFCRGIYSYALRDGKLYFGPENYSLDDPMASPPGTLYQEPSEQDIAIFSTKSAFISGPHTDEYGTFIYGLAPVIDPDTGEVLMAVGMDVLVKDWFAKLNAVRVQVMLPGVLLIVLFFVLLFAFPYTIKQSKDWQYLSLKKWILWPVFGSFALILLLSLSFHIYGYFLQVKDSSSFFIEQSKHQLQSMILDEVELLQTEIRAFADRLLKADVWETSDNSLLRSETEVFFRTAQKKYAVDSARVISKDRIVLFRASDPERAGDRVDNRILLEAERLEKDFWGLLKEGESDRLMIRYVHSVHRDGRLLGYISFGKDFETVRQKLSTVLQGEVVVVLRKKGGGECAKAGGPGGPDQTCDERKAIKEDFVILSSMASAAPFTKLKNVLNKGDRGADDSGENVLIIEEKDRYFLAGRIHLLGFATEEDVNIFVLKEVTDAFGDLKSAVLIEIILVMIIILGLASLLFFLTGSA
ncbi:MAG TPA: hypothetical protein P5246_07860, partial [Candidatus Omnitrophota bacterium]|nr:hypothetical protein [Candidatus Omnitrophota bacterium]